MGTGTLSVQLKTLTASSYEVPESVYLELLASSNQEEYFLNNIKHRFLDHPIAKTAGTSRETIKEHLDSSPMPMRLLYYELDFRIEQMPDSLDNPPYKLTIKRRLLGSSDVVTETITGHQTRLDATSKVRKTLTQYMNITRSHSIPEDRKAIYNSLHKINVGEYDYFIRSGKVDEGNAFVIERRPKSNKKHNTITFQTRVIPLDSEQLLGIGFTFYEDALDYICSHEMPLDFQKQSEIEDEETGERKVVPHANAPISKALYEIEYVCSNLGLKGGVVSGGVAKAWTSGTVPNQWLQVSIFQDLRPDDILFVQMTTSIGESTIIPLSDNNPAWDDLHEMGWKLIKCEKNISQFRKIDTSLKLKEYDPSELDFDIDFQDGSFPVQ
jgi:hypothetical protein